MDEKNSEKYGYPVGKLEDIHVYFTHYETFEQAKQKWIEPAEYGQSLYYYGAKRWMYGTGYLFIR